jgi:mono/diheme cytochrome c family protein
LLNLSRLDALPGLPVRIVGEFLMRARSVVQELVLALGLAALLGADAPAPKGSAAPVDYNKDVRPILSKNCFACHGADEKKRERGLRLDVRTEAMKELKSGAIALVPNAPDESDLIARLTDEDETLRMPPKSVGGRLDKAEIEILRRWVSQGADYPEHWSLVKPIARPLPRVNDPAWCRNGIDFWVLQRLEKEGLNPSREADRFTLFRRASLDLRGLPPTIEELDAYANDKSTDAYEKAVGRFLDDPAFGERWARPWLDLARYADSAGYGSDPLRTIWRYRDWVIDALNQNKPFDQFTIEQIAGDLLPDATIEQRVATAFHRNTMTNTEGGTDDEEFRVAAIKDRVDSTFQVWMGLTMGCAKCHSHKYDPITHEEYYKSFAIFNQTTDADRPDESPLLSAPSVEQQAENRRIDARVAELKTQSETPTAALAQGQEKWEASLRGSSEWAALDASSLKAESGVSLESERDGSIRVKSAEGSAAPAREVYTIVGRTKLTRITALRIEALPDPALPKGGSGRADDGNFVLSGVTIKSDGQGKNLPRGRFVRVELPGPEKLLSLAEVEVFRDGANVARKGTATQSSTDFEGEARRANDGNTDGYYFDGNSVTHTRGEANPWWEVKLDSVGPIERIVVWNRTDAGTVERLANARVSVLDDAHNAVWQESLAEAPNPKREWKLSDGRQPVVASASADFAQDGFPASDLLQPTKKGAAKGWAVAPKQSQPHSVVLTLRDPLTDASTASLTIRLEHTFKQAGYALGRFRLSVTSDETAARRGVLQADVLAAIDKPVDQRTKAQTEILAAHYRGIAPELKPVRDEIARLEKARPTAPTVPVMVELSTGKNRETHLLEKGNFLTPGKPVTAGVPASLPSLPKGASADRLALARWLVSPENPLTARVAVNRYWSQLFGGGIVETEEDFGTQGELPSHPELLDWMAVEYMKMGWDTKAMLRKIITSATYRQSSRVTPELIAKDPRNRLLSRGPRFRLEAEMVRDQALALSGLLSRKMRGPSVFPPQPEGLWQAAFNGQRTWATSPGEDQHRRGLYTFWRRTVPYPSMAAFDAPSREICSVKRSRTNTPLQAFVTLNDPVYLEAAQALARRIVTEGGSSPEDRARFGLKLALCRPPADEQVNTIVALYQSERAHHAKDTSAATALATEPLGPLPKGMDPAELAAWTTVANVLLNLDVVLSKG